MSETKLKSTIALKIKDETVEILASFALVQELAALCGDMERTQYALMAPDAQPLLIDTALAKRSESGEILEGSPSHRDLSVDQADELMEWIGEHVIDFFLRAARRLERTLARTAPQIEALNKSVAGLAASTSKTQ